MACSPAYDSLRLVGDPVDVVTGACIEVSWEFELRCPIPFTFRRHYDSRRRQQELPLGWGHSHEYDRSLTFDVDGVRYRSGVSRTAAFPPLLEDGNEAAAQGLRLVRVRPLQYEVRESDGTVGEYAFDSPQTSGRLQRLRRGGHSIQFMYDPHGRLATVIDSSGRFIRVDSHPSGRLLALVLVTDGHRAEKPLMRLSYDSAGHLAAGVDAHGHTFTFEYDHRGRLTRKTDRRGYSFLYEYDEDDRCVHSRGSDGLHEVRLRYLPNERVTIVTKADGGEWTYLYDEQGTITRIVDPYGGVRSFEIDAHGRVAAEIDPNGNALQWVYDANGAKLGRRSPFGELLTGPDLSGPSTAHAHRVPRCALEWEYGHLVARDIIGASPKTDTVLRELPARIRERLWTLPEWHHDGQSNGAGARRDGRTYDLTGFRILEHKPHHPPRRWQYDAGGNTHRYHDYDGSVHEYEYVSWDLRSAHVDPLGNTTRYTHATTGEIESVTDPAGTRTRYEYDLKNRLCRVSRDGEQRDEYGYDDADNLVEKLDGNGEWLLRFEIGPDNTKLARHLASGGTHRFEYDDRGRYIKAATDDFEVTLGYDAFGQRMADERDGRGVRHRFRGPRALARTTLLGRFSVSYRRTPGGSIGITDPTGGEHRIEFPVPGLVRRILSNDTRETTQFDSDGRCLLRYSEHVARRRSWTRAYRYSGEGDLLDSYDDRTGQTRFRYDAAHRLQSVSYSDGTIGTYRFDAAGNLLEQPGLADVRVASGNRLRAANGEMFQYDHRSRVVIRRNGHTATHYEYDSRDMLARANVDGVEWSAEYDPLGRRIRKSFDGRETTFYWDSDRVAAETRSDGSVRVYVYADEFSIVPMMFVDYESVDADARDGKCYFVFCNHLSTPVSIEDHAGSPVWSARIEPFGQSRIAQGSPLTFALRFPGHYYDDETGLHYNRFRYYDPVLGRYLQSDPLGVLGGLNLYAYARANPISHVDVRGVCPGGPTEEGDDPDASEEKPDAEPKLTAAERLAARRAQQREERRQAALAEAIAKADAEGRLGDLDPADRAWIESQQRYRELAIDPDGDGSYRVQEARDAVQAEADGQLTPPVRRATRKADEREAGADFIDGDDGLWDHKDQSMGADDIAETAAPPRGDPENVIVGCSDLSDADQAALENDVNNNVANSGRNDAGDVVFVPKR